MKKGLILLAAAVITSLTAFSQEDKKITKTAHINFFSHTSIEDISADNYSVVSSISPSTGAVVFSAPMQSFKFEKSLMQKHFNSKDFLDSKQFPKAKFKGKISNVADVNFKKDGLYKVVFKGDLSLHGVTKSIAENGSIKISKGKIIMKVNMKVALVDYKISLKDGKPSNNVAKVIDVTVNAEY